MDREIDLTIERKFSTYNLLAPKGDKTNLFKNNNTNLVDLYIKRSDLLPWNKKDVIQNTRVRKIRKYDDAISDEFGATIRFTEDNTMLNFGDRIIHSEIMEEFFMESIGRIPYSNINICMRCGRKSIKHMSSFMFSECKTHDRLPRKWSIDI